MKIAPDLLGQEFATPSGPVDFQELPGAHDGNAPKRFELLKVVISCDDDLRLRFKGAFENPVVRLILGDDVKGFFRVDELGELLDGGDGLTRTLG